MEESRAVTAATLPHLFWLFDIRCINPFCRAWESHRELLSTFSARRSSATARWSSRWRHRVPGLDRLGTHMFQSGKNPTLGILHDLDMVMPCRRQSRSSTARPIWGGQIHSRCRCCSAGVHLDVHDGGLSGIFMAATPSFVLHDTISSSAHFHYVIVAARSSRNSAQSRSGTEMFGKMMTRLGKITYGCRSCCQMRLLPVHIHGIGAIAPDLRPTQY